MVTYVGNRCIMTPEGIWSSTKSYEALSVVSHQPTGDGYVSRRAVPTGIDISDDTYWVKMTDFNTQLSTIQAGVEKAEEDAAEALAGVDDKISKTKIIVTKEELLALLENGYVVDAALIRQLYNELNGKTPGAGTAGFIGDNPDDAALLMYKYGDTSWAGIGASPNGNAVLSIGVDSRYKYEFSPSGITLNGENILEPKMDKSGGTFTGPVRFQSALYGANLTQVTGNNGNEFHFKWEDGAISIYIDGVKIATIPRNVT